MRTAQRGDASSSGPQGNGRRPELDAFAARLRRLRLACGSPSYAALRRGSALLPPATVSDALGARVTPRLEFVIAYVQTCLTFAAEHALAVDPALADLGEWRQLWQRVRSESDAFRGGGGRTAAADLAGAAQYATDGAATGEDRAGLAESGSHPGDVTPPPPDRSTPAPWQLPNPVRRLYGREREVRWLSDLLLGEIDASLPMPHGVVDGGSSPIAVLEGMGGVGKTAIVLAWGHRYRHRFPDGELFVDLSGFGPRAPVDPVHVLADFVRALGATPRMISNDADALSALFRTLCADRRMLIVLDNAAGVDQVRPLLPAAPEVAVVVTTRAAMTGLAVREDARRLVVGPLGAEDAAALLTRDLPDVDPQRVDRLIAACGNLPLALRLVSARWELDPGDPVIEALASRSAARRPEDLLSSLADPNDQVSDIGAVFSWSFDRCPPAERRALLLLSAAPSRSVDDFAAAALLGLPVAGARQLLTGLADCHLLDRPVPGYWRMHDLVRIWVHGQAVRLLGSAQVADALDRVLGYYLFVADAADRVLLPQRNRPPLNSELPGPLGVPRIGDRADALAWGDDHLSDLVDAVAAAGEAGRHLFAATLPTIMLSYLDLRKPWAQWLTLCRIGLDSAAVLNDPHITANLHLASGIVYRETDALDAAIDAQRDAAAAFGAAGNQVGVAMALNNLGSVYNEAGRPAEAREVLMQAALELSGGDDRYRRAIVLHNLAETEISLREFDAAHEHATGAIIESQAVGDDLGVALTRSTLGEVQLRLGRTEAAELEFRAALSTQRSGQDRLGQATTQRRLGRLLLETDQPAAALAELRESVEILTDLGDSDSVESLALLTEAEQRLSGAPAPNADGPRPRSERRRLLRRGRRRDGGS